MEEDAYAIRAIASAGMPMLVSNSFSKIFSLYGERVGGLSVVCEDSETAGRVLGQLKATVRRNYSSPPSFGAQVVATVLNDAALKATWQAEVDAMRAHILTMRQALVDALQQVAPGSKVDYLLKQRGMFSYTGFSAAQVDRLREDGDPNHGSDIQRAVDKANKAREQGADVVAIAMHSVQEYLDYADSWQISEAHELADTGAFDVIYGAGCHCAQPIENYNGTWIVYGLGNTVTESANTPETLVNNQGVTARIQFAGKKGVKGSWRVNRIDWVPTANVHQGNYQWCPISSDHPIGTCWDEAYDAQIRQRIWDVIYSMGADQNVVKEWNITQEQAAKQ